MIYIYNANLVNLASRWTFVMYFVINGNTLNSVGIISSDSNDMDQRFG